jgi:hydrogenase/urease accessory protein HupE
MMTVFARLALAAAAVWLAAPAPLSAHAGHAGDHGWLAGAVQPLLSLDHFLAGLFVVAVVGLGVGSVAWRKGREARLEP